MYLGQRHIKVKRSKCPGSGMTTPTDCMTLGVPWATFCSNLNRPDLWPWRQVTTTTPPSLNVHARTRPLFESTNQRLHLGQRNTLGVPWSTFCSYLTLCINNSVQTFDKGRSNVLTFDLGFVDMSPWQPPPPHRNEMYVLGHAPFLNQPIRSLDSWQFMVNRFSLFFMHRDR